MTGREPEADELELDGYVESADEPYRVRPFDQGRFQAETARTLAYVLIGVIVLLNVLYAVCVTLLHVNGQREAASSLSSMLQTLSTGLFSLAGSAIGFFISTKSK